MKNSSGLAALLLAGGASTRMGKPKALLELADRPLWRLQVEKLQALQPSELFISIPRELALPMGPWQFLHDREPGLGPLSGLHSALTTMTARWLIVLAIDLPDMTPAYLQELANAALACGSGIVPLLDGYYQGTAAVYSHSMADLSGQCLAGDDRSLQHFSKGGVAKGLLRPYPVTEENRSLFHNVNRPEDLG